MVPLPPNQIKDLLQREGLIHPEQFDAALEEAERKRQNVLEVLISQGLLNKDYFYTILSKHLGTPRIRMRATDIDESVLRKLPEDVARSRRAIAFSRDPGGTFEVAMENPTDLETIDFLSLRLGGRIKAYLATDEDLDRGFSLYEEKLTQDFKKIIESSIRDSMRSKARGEEDLRQAAEDLPIVAIVDNLLAYSLSSRASDIHIEILDDAVMVRFRIDGVLHEIIRVPREIHPAVIARVKILSGLRVDEHSKPQDGRFRHKMGNDNIDIRVSSLPTFYGEKIVMRLLRGADKPLSFAELGLSDERMRDVVVDAISKSYGMFLVCGPTGSGKSTTLYSILNMLNRPEVNIVTVEDPIEYDMRFVTQVQVNPTAGITFSGGLRSILRQDPNIIMVGEIRDPETASISVQAALTGHVLLSSLHTNDAPTAIPRLIDMQVPPFLIAAVLNAVLAQRLTRRTHLQCIESYQPDEGAIESIRDQLKALGADQARARVPTTFYRGKGCEACGNTGYLGRVGIYEVLHVTEAIRGLIVSPNFDLTRLRELIRKEGMISMFEDGLRKVEEGVTTIDEVFRVIRE
ncbi:MAG: GspE/PulE family protein [Nanoarchaeota archaeon]|nr:GspE/PulE family protein [Nanoarchaeota archaeon]